MNISAGRCSIAGWYGLAAAGRVTGGLLLSACLLVCLSPAAVVMAADKSVKLTSLDWPPYTSPSLPDQGASAAVAKQAFAAMGYQLEVEFYPWKRAVALGKGDPAYAGYFPEYHAKEIEADFVFSDPMGDSPLGFAEHSAAPVTWASLADLKGIRIGTVSGYVNTAEFDAAVAKGELDADAAPSDDKNIQKLAAQRIRLAVIDQNVMNYLISNQFPEHKGTVRFNAKPLEIKKLHICFSKTEAGRNLAAVFNAGLKKIDSAKIVQDYLANLK